MPPPAAAAANAAPPAGAAQEVTDVLPTKKPFGRKKKILVIAAVVALLLAGGGAGAVYWLKKRAAAQAAEEVEPAPVEEAQAPTEKFDPKAVPVFVPLEMFTVNLADREAERYAQIGITLELTDAKASDQIKNYMPAIRNNILMVLSHKTSKELLERDGKLTLASEIVREAVRPLGFDLPPDGKRPLTNDDVPPPIKRVHFSNFIIQ
jgi:flagellar FliL protein